MFSKKNQRKQSPQEKLAEEERQKEQKRRGQIIKDTIYPLICETSENVEDAKIFLQTVAMAVEQGFLRTKKDRIVASLDIEENLRHIPEAERYRKMLEAVNGETVEVAVDLLSSMGRIIENNERQRSKDTKMADLPIKFITYGIE